MRVDESVSDEVRALHTKKMKFSITDFSSKCDQIRSYSPLMRVAGNS